MSTEQPIVTASFHVRDDTADRISRASTPRRSPAAKFGLIGVLVLGCLCVVLAVAKVGGSGSSTPYLLAIGGAVALFVALVWFLLIAVSWYVQRRLAGAFRRSLPVGSTMRADYFADRMVLTTGRVHRTTAYATVHEVWTADGMTIMRRDRGLAALPEELVPADARALLEAAPAR